MKTLNYKGFIGSIEVSLEDNCLYGKLIYVNDLVTYEAKTVKQLEVEFRKAVDDYLVSCHELKREPMKPFKGSLNVRIGPDLHKLAALRAAIQCITINEYIKLAIKKQLRREDRAV